MASAEMPGIPMKAATSTFVKTQDFMASAPASEKHMVAGRRKLEEFRKRKADLKNKATVKPILNDIQSEGLANGPNLAHVVEGNDRQVDFNGLDSQPASVIQEKRGEVPFEASQLEQASGGDSPQAQSVSKDSVHQALLMSGYVSTSAGKLPSELDNASVVQVSEENSNSSLFKSKISPQNYSSLTERGHGHLPWLENTQEAENRVMSKKNIVEHASEDNYDSLMFHHKESSMGGFSDGSFPRKNVGKSWKQPTESSRGGVSHESSVALGQDTDKATAIVSLVPSAKDKEADSMQNETYHEYRSSWLPNGRRSWDSKETQLSFAQPKKLPFLDRAEREPLFQSGLLDKPSVSPFSTVATGSLALTSSINHQEGTSSSLSVPNQSAEDTASDKVKESKVHKQQVGKEKHAENDDFAALEQHIDDLTQEKFALLRALEAARSLADSLSQQNSNLTEDFNSQGAIINQLQEDLEKKKEEVTAQSLVLSSLMMERERAQQENNSAVERSQILAGEVIGLEEKVLRLRSSELKLQKELENWKAENDSFRVQMATLEKDRKNLQNMFDALQEDKRLLQNQLQKAFSGTDSNATSNAKKGSQRDLRDASTSTEDSGLQRQNSGTAPSVGKSEESKTASTIVSLPNVLGFSLPSMFATLSPDDYRAIDGINELITELFSEKETLVDLLHTESAKAAEFEAMNYELTKKLETQTQRLELAVAQNMAFGGNAVTAMNTTEMEPHYNAYVDEGDEVVERVLGWMRIFPGGSSKRQNSKRL